MNEGTILIAILCMSTLPLAFGAGYIVGRAGGFCKMLEPPESPSLQTNYPTMQDVFAEMRRRDLDQRDHEACERFEQQRERVELLQYDNWDPLPLDPLPNAYVAGGSDVSLDTVSVWRGAAWDETIEQSKDGIT